MFNVHVHFFMYKPTSSSSGTFWDVSVDFYGSFWAFITEPARSHEQWCAIDVLGPSHCSFSNYTAPGWSDRKIVKLTHKSLFGGRVLFCADWINRGRDEMVWTRFICTGIYEPREARTVHCYSIQGGSKSKLLILSEYVDKTEKIGGVWTNTNM